MRLCKPSCKSTIVMKMFNRNDLQLVVRMQTRYSRNRDFIDSIAGSSPPSPHPVACFLTRQPEEARSLQVKTSYGAPPDSSVGLNAKLQGEDIFSCTFFDSRPSFLDNSIFSFLLVFLYDFQKNRSN